MVVNLRDELDALYAAFCETLPNELRTCARELPFRLKMGPTRSTPWSRVLGQEVTFAAPALFAEAMPEVHPSLVRQAVLAHALAVIEAFGTDRLEDGQIPPSPQIERILEHARTTRDGALARVGVRADPLVDFGRAGREMLSAIAMERDLLEGMIPTTFSRYEAIALGKARIGFPASLALARAVGWDDERCETVAKTLSAIWLGMQYHDDVVDWEDDLRRGSAWAILLARSTRIETPPRDRPTERDPIRKMILESGVLARMLRRAYRHFRAARLRAEALGCRQLATWARAKERHGRALVENETRSSGYAVRAHALAPWAAEVLT
jgi:hypothetical protein